MDRRSLIGLGTTALAGLSFRAAASSSGASTQNVGTEIALWPGMAPGGNGVNLKLEIENRGFWPNQTDDRALSGLSGRL